MTALLQVQQLNVTFQGDGETHQAVRDVSFEVHRGETVALIGESGSGKSVTALSTVDLLPDNATTSGSVIYEGEELLGASEKTLQHVRGNEISFIFQEPMTSLNPLQTIEKQIAESIELHQNLPDTDTRQRVIDLLERVGIRDPEQRLASYPHELSGGQRQRVMIAMALSNKPELLIADEPTTALDVTIQAQILELLAELKEKEQLSMLFITHDLAIVRRIADRVCVMKDGEIVEQGPTEAIFTAPEHPYTQMLLSAEDFGTPNVVAEDAPEVLKVEELRVWFPIKQGFFRKTVGHIKAVNSADLRLKQGETLGIVGESGSGKSTLALAILRLQHAQKGAVYFNGRDLIPLNQKQLRPVRADMQIVFQDPYGSLSPRMSVVEIVGEGLTIHNIDPERNRRELVAEMLEIVGIDPATMDRYPHEFSGGQRQRIAIARAMILRPELVVLDEPTSALDRTIQTQIVDLLKDLQLRYKLSYLFISHDLSVVRALSNRVIVMKEGDIVETGETEQVYQAPTTDYTRDLIKAALLTEG